MKNTSVCAEKHSNATFFAKNVVFHCLGFSIFSYLCTRL